MSMKKIALALAMALGLVAAQKASATTEYYQLKGGTCTSITSGVTGQYNIYGVSPNGSTAMDVTCPVILPARTYTGFIIGFYGYSRSTPDKLSCTITSTDYGGSDAATSTATVPSNTANSQYAETSISPSNGYDDLLLTCHIPATTTSGPSYLTSITLGVTY
jgi:hypothetical protein